MKIITLQAIEVQPPERKTGQKALFSPSNRRILRHTTTNILLAGRYPDVSGEIYIGDSHRTRLKEWFIAIRKEGETIFSNLFTLSLMIGTLS